MWIHWWSSSVVLVTCTVTMTIISCLPQILLKMFAFPLLCCLGVGGMSAGSLVFIHQFVHYLLSFTTVNSKYSLIFCLLACIKYCIWRLGVLSQYLCWLVKTDLKVCCWKVIIHLMLPVCSSGRSPALSDIIFHIGRWSRRPGCSGVGMFLLRGASCLSSALPADWAELS